MDLDSIVVKADGGYDAGQMDLEIQRVARELYKAFSGMNEGFKEAKDQIVIDELSSHTDSTRQQLIHPYKVVTDGEKLPATPFLILYRINHFCSVLS